MYLLFFSVFRLPSSRDSDKKKDTAVKDSLQVADIYLV
jgi:hypothetical protein